MTFSSNLTKTQTEKAEICNICFEIDPVDHQTILEENRVHLYRDECDPGHSSPGNGQAHEAEVEGAPPECSRAQRSPHQDGDAV